jgi:DNA-binding GntR family transcriptional regulator
MELHLQFGYGMMDLSKTLVRKHGGGTVILSPRDLAPESLENFSTALRKAGGAPLLDPQF